MTDVTRSSTTMAHQQACYQTLNRTTSHQVCNAKASEPVLATVETETVYRNNDSAHRYWLPGYWWVYIARQRLIRRKTLLPMKYGMAWYLIYSREPLGDDTNE